MADSTRSVLEGFMNLLPGEVQTRSGVSTLLCTFRKPGEGEDRGRLEGGCRECEFISFQ